MADDQTLAIFTHEGQQVLFLLFAHRPIAARQQEYSVVEVERSHVYVSARIFSLAGDGLLSDELGVGAEKRYIRAGIAAEPFHDSHPVIDSVVMVACLNISD